jgi:hypothetical protein
MGLYERLFAEGEEEEGYRRRSSERPEGVGLIVDTGLSPWVARSRLMGLRGRYMERFRVVRAFNETGGGDSPDHASRASGAPWSHVLLDARWCYRRRPSSSLGRSAGRGALADWLE